MPAHQSELALLACGLLLAALACAALYHMVPTPNAPWIAPDLPDHADEDSDTDQDAAGPYIPDYQLPTLRYRPLVPPYDLTTFTFM